MLFLSSLNPKLSHRITGTVTSIKGEIVLARMPSVSSGVLCYIEHQSLPLLPGITIGFCNDQTYVAPLEEPKEISPTSKIWSLGAAPRVSLPSDKFGYVIDPLGRFIQAPNESRNTVGQTCLIDINQSPPDPIQRTPIKDIFPTGIRCIDALCTIGYGQRIGLFSSAGLGKSTLLGMLAKGAQVDCCVIAMVGERGREVKEFLDSVLGPKGMSRSIVVCSTSDETPIKRALAAESATAIAEFYRSQGKRVLLLVDSLTRVARAYRDLALAQGEFPVRHGFPASVYTKLARLLERAGNDKHGSITAIYTLLTQHEYEPDAMAEEVKSILDGHIILSQRIKESGVAPYIDPLSSVSRLFNNLHGRAHFKVRDKLIRMISRLSRDRDLVLMGGSPDIELQRFIDLEPTLRDFMSQEIFESSPLSTSLEMARKIAELIDSSINIRDENSFRD